MATGGFYRKNEGKVETEQFYRLSIALYLCFQNHF